VPRRSAAGWPCRRAAVPLSPRRRAVDKAAAGAPAPGEAGDEGDTRAGAPRAGRRHSPGHARGLRVQAQGRGVLAVAGARPGADVLAVAVWGAEATRRVGGEHGRLGTMVP